MIKKNWPYWIFAAIILAIPIYVVLTSDSFNYCVDHQGKYPATQGEQDQSSSLPIAGKVAIAISCMGSYSNINGVAITAIATLLLTFVTAGLVYTAYLQIRTGRVQLRAYVYPEAADLFETTLINPPIPERANIPFVQIAWKNTGQTPASNVILWSHMEVIEPINEDKLVVPPLVNRNFTNLGSGGTGSKSFYFYRPLTQSEMSDVFAGVKAIYLYGRIQYKDIFGDDWHTNFRLNYSGHFPPKSIPATFSICENGNDAK